VTTRLEDDPLSVLAVAVRESALVPEDSSGVAMVSGGPDSACLAAALVALVGAENVIGLHVNYRLRPDSDEDEAVARALCRQFAIDLVVERPELPEGNVQAAARDARYGAAKSLGISRDLDWIATGHTRTDLAETVIYRLASSPGRRALLGLAPRRGRIIRPLLALSREATRELATAGNLPFRDDPSNEDPAFARARIRRDVMPTLKDINSSAEENIASTWAELAQEAEALDALADEVLAGTADAPALGAAVLTDLHPAIRRLVLRAFIERRANTSVALPADRATEIWRLMQTQEGGEVDLGRGLRALCEAGHVRVGGPPEATPEPVELAVPGVARFGAWELRAERVDAEPDANIAEVEFNRNIPEPDTALLDAQAVGARLTVRAWRDGDRMRPLGLDGTKSLQDLFTDRRIPRSLRRTLPVVAGEGDRILWVAGVAISDEAKVGESTRSAVRLHAAAYTGAR